MQPHGQRAAEPGGAELDALVFGVKPALRLVLSHAELARMEARLRDAGMHLVRARRNGRHVLYASRDASRAEELARLEARLALDGFLPRALFVDTQLAIGALLGYPPCCVRAFASRYVRRGGVVRRTIFRRPRPDYTAAREAWVARPRPRLNQLRAGTHAALISFEPCSFECAAATALADAIAGAVREKDAPRLARIDALLARAVAIARDDVRVVVELDAERTRIVAATPPSRDARPAHAALAERLQGAQIGPDGAVGDDVLVVDFGRT